MPTRIQLKEHIGLLLQVISLFQLEAVIGMFIQHALFTEELELGVLSRR